MSLPRPAADAALSARRARRSRAIRHAAVLGGGVALLATAGVVAGGAALGEWSFPFVPDSIPEETVQGVATTVALAPATAPTCGPDGVVAVAGAADSFVVVLNGAGTQGLANTVRDELVARGFVVTDVGNAAAPASGTTEVRYPPDQQAQALALSLHLAGQAPVVPDTAVKRVTLVLGPDFAALAGVDEAAARLSGDILAGCPAATA